MKNPHIVTRADWATAEIVDELGWCYCGRCFAGQREEVECNA